MARPIGQHETVLAAFWRAAVGILPCSLAFAKPRRLIAVTVSLSSAIPKASQGRTAFPRVRAGVAVHDAHGRVAHAMHRAIIQGTAIARHVRGGTVNAAPRTRACTLAC